jgi:hypothetical protein
MASEARRAAWEGRTEAHKPQGRRFCGLHRPIVDGSGVRYSPARGYFAVTPILPLQPHSVPGRSGRYFYYQCRRRYKVGPDTCTNTRCLPAPDLEEKVWR